MVVSVPSNVRFHIHLFLSSEFENNIEKVKQLIQEASC